MGICIGLLLAGSLSADSRFTGAVSELWSDPGNWTAGLPDQDDKVQCDAGVLCILDYDAGVIKNMALEGGGGARHVRLVDGAKLTVWDWSIIAYTGGEQDARHTLEVLGGVYNGGDANRAGNSGRIYVGREGFARLVIDNSGVVNLITQEMTFGQGTNGDGVAELRGGTLNLTDNGDHPLRFATGTNAKGYMDISGGVIKQRFSDGRLTRINGYIANGNITAYGGVGTVLVETLEDELRGQLIIVKGVHPMNPVPEDGANIAPGNITLSWTVDAGTPVDVWFTTKANPDEWTEDDKIVNKQAVTSLDVTTVAKQRYFWAVDTYGAGAEVPDFGSVFDFYAGNIAPVVYAGDDVTTWLDNGSADVALAGAVTDADLTTTVWTVASEPDDPNSPDAVIADAAALNTSITLSAPGAYVLQLEADDGEYTGSDTVTINVFSDHCEAAKSLPGWTAIPGDLNLDCVVDQLDMDILSGHWLECNGLDCPDPNAP